MLHNVSNDIRKAAERRLTLALGEKTRAYNDIAKALKDKAPKDILDPLRSVGETAKDNVKQAWAALEGLTRFPPARR